MVDPALFHENERTAPTSARQIMPIGDLTTEQGSQIANAEIAWQSWGTYDGSNAVLVCHALSGDSNCVGWWDRVVGPGKPIDTDRWFVIGSNVLGGCQGSTGPATLDQEGRRLGSRFPFVTVGDMVEAQARLLDRLGVPRLALVCGGSMGGMQALEWATRFPDRVDRCWMTASCAAHSAMQIGFNETARQAVMRDPKWLGGDFPAEDPPRAGLAVARMVGHLSYLSDSAFEAKFARRLQDKEAFDFHAGIEFQVESYLSHQGDKFTHRFDAQSLIVLTRAIDYYSRSSLAGASASFLFTSFTSDWIYPTRHSQDLLQMAQDAGLQAEHFEIDLPFGHDAFLLDGELQGQRVRDFLA